MGQRIPCTGKNLVILQGRGIKTSKIWEGCKHEGRTSAKTGLRRGWGFKKMSGKKKRWDNGEVGSSMVGRGGNTESG